MAKLNLKDLKIEMPKDFNGKPNDAEFVEWLEYEFGARSDIKLSNPLHVIELKDCKVCVGEAKIDGKPFVF
jgi:hypothetical protein